MTTSMTRRGVLAGSIGIGGAGILAGCLGSGGTTGGPSDDDGGSTEVVLQSSIQDEGPKEAIEQIAADFEEYDVTLNSVATEQYRAQLSTYLTSPTPPDVLTWYAGSVANSYASQGLLMDVSELWEGDGPCANYSEALKSLSSSEEGQQIFIPTNYYWWSIFYRPSTFEQLGRGMIRTCG